MTSSFNEFFRTATGGCDPYPYQQRFAEADPLPHLLRAPTGAGKTATAVLGWLWRWLSQKPGTPRRLVYCLPMRVLVEQSERAAKGWIKSLSLDVPIHVLMGGVNTEQWFLHPEKPAVLIGTQDMLLSRALNRGYAASRFHWPIDFGLLNNDCLWVFDEIQLMGVGLATSAQLEAFRRHFGAYGQAKTVWMSATLLPSWLETVDLRAYVANLRTLALTDADYQAAGLKERWEGPKPIKRAMATVDDLPHVAQLVREKHVPGSLTLVVVNTVDRSRKLFEQLQKVYQPAKRSRRGGVRREPQTPAAPPPDLKLIHSRFRPRERQAWMDWLKSAPPPEGRIVVSTQVVEAGVDISAQTLWTDLAPWPSLVQRFGRCNRRGEFARDNGAQIYWIDVPAKDDKGAAPYTKEELDAARKHLEKLEDADLKSLHDFFETLSDKQREELFPYDPLHVIRRKDFIDLFDTTPDLAGNDVDVSRFIREGDDLDVQVFWRTEKPPSGELDSKEARQLAPARDELCPVPVREFREFVEKKKAVFRWDPLDGRWIKARREDIYPGQVFWIPKDQGGYSLEIGWDPKAVWPDDADLEVPQRPEPKTEEPEYDSDLLSVFGWRSIAEHTDDVMTEIEMLARNNNLDAIPWNILGVAARWHDWGKAHSIFQAAIKDETDGEGKRPEDRAGRRDIAKAAPQGFWRRYSRKHFRHELASALGVLTLLRHGQAPSDWAALPPPLQNLALYLIAAHHGKVRLSIRSMPDERKPDEPDKLFARGVWDGDPLPAIDLGGGVYAPEVTLDLSPMQLGRGKDGSPSWAERMLSLRDHAEFGPLKLAYLEALLRAADMRASKKADERAKGKNYA
jgi:CRISPR-associated endonuclease/helicase Cas3